MTIHRPRQPRTSHSALLIAPILIPLLASAPACGAEPSLPGLDAPSRTVIADATEPGPQLEVEGIVYAPDGQTPAPGVVLYVYQTDRTGLYAPSGSIPRLRGYVKTDAHGRYAYRTVRPASYPRSTIAAHIHTQLWGGGAETQWNQDLLFADDPFLTDRDRRDSAAAGRFAWICDAKPDADGISHCTHNLRLKPRADELQDNIRHGLDNPPRK